MERMPMKKSIPVLLAILLLVLGLVGCGGETSAQKEAVDDAIHDVESALGRYMTTDPQGPAEEIVEVTDGVVAAWENVGSTAEGLDEIDLSNADAALAQLVEATAQIPEDVTAREAFELIEPQVEAFEDEVDEIHDTLDMH
jgi:uncharacterized protein Yka (UPF0111/DUF47 family)